MMTSLNSVFVGNYAAPSDLMNVTAADLKSIFFEDAKGNVLTAPTTKQPFYVCQVVGIDVVDGNNVARVRKSPAINPINLKNKDFLATATPADLTAAKVEETIKIDLTGITIDPAARYVLRIQYKDLTYFGAEPAYYTHSYEVFGDTVANAAALADAFRRQIIAQDSARVNVDAAGSPVINLTSKEKDNNDGLWSPNDWSQVTMAASVYKTTLRDSVLFNNYYQVVSGAVIAVATPHNPGKGYWKEARDAERHALAYQGYTNQAIPQYRQKPEVFTEEGAVYSVLTIDFDADYLSADNQYRKTDPFTVRIYTNNAKSTPATLLTDTQKLLGL